jgi:tetratricopeptide (TPR) repeat protein
MGQQNIDTEYDYYNREGIKFTEEKQYKRAILSFDKALKLDPSSPQAWANKGSALSSLGLHKRAIGCIDKAIRINPNVWFSWYLKARCLNGLGKYDQVVLCYDKAIVLYSSRSYNNSVFGVDEDFLWTLYLYKADFLSDFKGSYQMREAFETYEQVFLNRKEGKTDVMLKMGSLFINNELYEEAILYFDSVLSFTIDQKLVFSEPYILERVQDTWYKKGLCFMYLSNAEQAIECFDEALSLKPNCVASLNNKGCVLAMRRRHKEAIDYFKKALEFTKIQEIEENTFFALQLLDGDYHLFGFDKMAFF